MTITAKYPGTCTKCHEKINPGEQINWEKSVGASHVNCPATPEYEIHDVTSYYEKQWRPATVEEINEKIKLAAEYNGKTVDEISALLTDRNSRGISYAKQPNFYYTHGENMIRRYQKPPAPPKMKKCACGHTVPVSLVMSASTGSSCADCYDKMSE